MLKKSQSTLFAVLILVQIFVPIFNVAVAKEFSDLNKMHPNFAAIDYLSNNGVLSGYADGTFKPDQLVNRAETLKIVFLGLEITIDQNIATNELFSDIKGDEWFAKYLAYAKSKGIVSGNPDGTYAPIRNVKRDEFAKILLNSVDFNKEQWAGQELFADVPKDAWFNPFMNYAGKAGLISKDNENKLYPEKELSRSEAAEILYLMLVIRKANDSQFLIDQANAQMALVEGYIGASDLVSAKRAADLAVDLTQQALKNRPEDMMILAVAKLARCYNYLVTSFVYALQKDFPNATKYAEMLIVKADEAIAANLEVKEVAEHLKARANEILNQLPKL